MKLTVVMDNMVPFGASKPFVGEHGYSLLIETAGKRVLLDAGQSGAVVRNLSLLGLHPDELDAIVISHGHFDHAGGDCQDSIADDTSLYYRNKKGLVVLSGCAHAGLVNTVEHGFAVTGTDTLLGWVGGTHLGPVGAEQQTKTLEQIEAYAPQFIAASHCTGFAMMAALERRLGERFVNGMVGQVIEVPE